MKIAKARCGLCGKTANLTRTSCCGNWICNDHQKYVLFSYARNSCARNHDRYTLCSFHHQNEHQGHWKDCKSCRESFETEIYVWYGTNEYNFEVLENPPEYEPTHCDRCGTVIKLGTDGYTVAPSGTFCERCADLGAYKRLSVRQPRRQRKAPAQPNKAQLAFNSDPSAIEIIVSARVQTRWRIQPTVRASEPPAHWLGQWRIDFGRKADRTQVALITNVATLYTFVFPLKELDAGRNLPDLFRLRLGVAVQDAPALAPWTRAPILFAAGNPRMVVGSMNDMRKHLAWRTELPAGPIANEEERINRTPFLSLDEAFPHKAFAKRLAESGRSKPLV